MMTEETEANIKGRIEKYAKSSWSGQHMWKYAHHYFAAAYAPVVLLYYLPELVMPVARSAYIYVCASTLQYTVAANIQWQWSEATALTLPRPPRHLYHHQCHSLTSRQLSTFPLSPSEEDKKHFPIFFVLNLRSFRASLCLTPVCSHFCSPRFMGLAFSYTLYKCAFPNITLAPMYLITVNLPAFLNFA